MTRKNNMIAPFAIAVSLLVIIIFLTQGYADSLNLDSAVGTGIASVLPGIFITLFGLYAVKQTSSSPMSIGSFGAIGIGLAVLLAELYSESIINAGMIYPATIIQVETLVIVMSLLMGGVVYAVKSR